MTGQANAKQKSALSLAYLGDAVYESLVREYVMEHSDAAPAALHKLTVSVVCAEAQSEALALLSDYLTEEESAVARRGRNASKATVPRHVTPRAYRAATALEALFGYLSMAGKDGRIRDLFRMISENQIDRLLFREYREQPAVSPQGEGVRQNG